MTFPALVFSFLVASMFGSLLHLWKGGGLGRLFLYLILSWIGFAIGHAVAGWLDVRFIEVGTIHLGMGVLGTLVLLGFGYWLSLVDFQNN
jgi:hypothetical protein